MAGRATLTADESTAAIVEARIAAINDRRLTVCGDRSPVRALFCGGLGPEATQRLAASSGSRTLNTVRPGRESTFRLPW